MHLKDKIGLIERRLVTDQRGWFLKAINGHEKGLPQYTGEIYLSCGAPGQARGGHYHNLAQEWFTLISGHALLLLEDIHTHETLSLELDCMQPVTIYVPPGIAHQFVNKSRDHDFIVVAYTDALYDPDDIILYPLSC